MSDKVLASKHITVADLTAAGVLPVPAEAQSPLPKLAKAKAGHGQMNLDVD